MQEIWIAGFNDKVDLMPRVGCFFYWLFVAFEEFFGLAGSICGLYGNQWKSDSDESFLQNYIVGLSCKILMGRLIIAGLCISFIGCAMGKECWFTRGNNMFERVCFNVDHVDSKVEKRFHLIWFQFDNFGFGEIDEFYEVMKFHSIKIKIYFHSK